MTENPPARNMNLNAVHYLLVLAQFGVGIAIIVLTWKNLVLFDPENFYKFEEVDASEAEEDPYAFKLDTGKQVKEKEAEEEEEEEDHYFRISDKDSGILVDFYANVPESAWDHSKLVEKWQTLRSNAFMNLTNAFTWIMLLVIFYLTPHQEALRFWRAPSSVLLMVTSGVIYQDMRTFKEEASKPGWDPQTQTQTQTEEGEEADDNPVLPTITRKKFVFPENAPPTMRVNDGTIFVRHDLIKGFDEIHASKQGDDEDNDGVPDIYGPDDANGVLYAGFVRDYKRYKRGSKLKNVIILNFVLGVLVFLEGLLGRFIPIDKTNLTWEKEGGEDKVKYVPPNKQSQAIEEEEEGEDPEPELEEEEGEEPEEEPEIEKGKGKGRNALPKFGFEK